MVRKLAAEVPGQILWGFFLWPRTGNARDRRGECGVVEGDEDGVEPFREIDDEAVLGNVREWVGEEAWWRMENPSAIFA